MTRGSWRGILGTERSQVCGGVMRAACVRRKQVTREGDVLEA